MGARIQIETTNLNTELSPPDGEVLLAVSSNDNRLYYKYPNGLITAVGLKGDQGPQGPGLIGPTGSQGPMGFKGYQGVQGFGPTGPQGITGSQGDQGPQGSGVQGATGYGVYTTTQSNPVDFPSVYAGESVINSLGSVYQWDGFVWGYEYSILGPQGVTGIQGPTGVQGLTGPQGFGPTGPQGTQGVQGITGSTGNRVLTTTQSNPFYFPPSTIGDSIISSIGAVYQWTGAFWTYEYSVIGPQGVQGPQGITGFQGASGGPQGLQGPTGSQGDQGTQGFQGYVGPQGSTGPQGSGSTGPTGPNGPTGSNLIQIDVTPIISGTSNGILYQTLSGDVGQNNTFLLDEVNSKFAFGIPDTWDGSGWTASFQIRASQSYSTRIGDYNGYSILSAYGSGSPGTQLVVVGETSFPNFLFPNPSEQANLTIYGRNPNDTSMVFGIFNGSTNQLLGMRSDGRTIFGQNVVGYSYYDAFVKIVPEPYNVSPGVDALSIISGTTGNNAININSGMVTISNTGTVSTVDIKISNDISLQLNKSVGTVSLVSGSASVVSSLVTTSSIILLTKQEIALGVSYPISAQPSMGSFMINSANSSDTDVVGYMIINTF